MIHEVNRLIVIGKLRLSPILVFLLLWLHPSIRVSAQQSFSVTDSTTPAGLSPGSPRGSYPLSSFESYSPFTGKVNLAIKAHTVQGRGSARYDMTVLIADQFRVVKQADGTAFDPLVSWGTWAPWTVGYGPGTVFPAR